MCSSPCSAWFWDEMWAWGRKAEGGGTAAARVPSSGNDNIFCISLSYFWGWSIQTRETKVLLQLPKI